MDNTTTEIKELITVYDTNGKVRETIRRNGDEATRDLASLLYHKIRKFNYSVSDKGYGNLLITSRDDFGKVTYEFNNCDSI